MNTPIPLYTPPDVNEAYERHGSNCGPAALAALLGRPILRLWPVIEPFPGYMSYAHMARALRFLRVPNVTMRKDFKLLEPSVDTSQFFGRLTIIQWGGRWMEPGLPAGASLRHTHWIAVRHSPAQVYDVNAGGAGGWAGVEAWKRTAERIMQHVKKCDGTWSVRSTILVREPLEVAT